MFITVKFGRNCEKIFNPNCRVINLVSEIKRKCCSGDDHMEVELTDEMGVIANLAVSHKYDNVSSTMERFGTYVLVEKIRDTDIQKRSEESRQIRDFRRLGICMLYENFWYIPLLHDVHRIYPDYRVQLQSDKTDTNRLKNIRRKPSRVSLGTDSPRGRRRSAVQKLQTAVTLMAKTDK